MVDMWPITTLTPADILVDPLPRNTRGGAGVAFGESQIVASDAGYWIATLSEVVVRTEAQRLEFKKMQLIMEGGLTPILLQLRAADQPITGGTFALWDPWPRGLELFFGSGGVDIELASDADREDVTLSLTITTSRTLVEGMQFSFGAGGELHRIKKINSQSASAAEIVVWPPLRADWPATTGLEFENPKLLARLASDNGASLMLRQWKRARCTLDFVEAL